MIGLNRTAVLAAVVGLVFAGFAIAVPGFADAQNLLRQMHYWVAPGIVAVAMTFVIATGGIDLSVGAIAAVAGVTLGLLFNDAGWPIWAAALAAFAVACAAGSVNGAAAGYIGVPPLVVTLATMALFRGAAMGLSGAKALGGYPDAFLWLGEGRIIGIPVGLILLGAIGLLGAVALRRSWLGRRAEQLGENETAAAFAAVDVRRAKLLLYTACGAAAGLAGLYHAALYGSAKADMAMGLELEAIACVVVGGTRISGGRATVAGTLLGLALIGILRYGLDMADVSSTHIVIAVGVLLIATAVVNERLGGRTQ